MPDQEENCVSTFNVYMQANFSSLNIYLKLSSTLLFTFLSPLLDNDNWQKSDRTNTLCRKGEISKMYSDRKVFSNGNHQIQCVRNQITASSLLFLTHRSECQGKVQFLLQVMDLGRMVSLQNVGASREC